MQDLSELGQLLATPKKIVITTHQKPDADALGSSLAWHRYLVKKGHDAVVITPTDYPQFLEWMQGNDEVIVFGDDTAEEAAKLVAEAEIIFCLDFNALGRIATLGTLVKNATAKKVLIDHHLAPESFPDLAFSDTGAAATAVLIYDIIVGLGDKAFLDTYIGECIYAGIMTDTGSFRHSNADRRVHLIVAELMLLNINAPRIHRLIYDTSTEERLRFIGYALSERLYVLPEYYTAFFTISAKDLERFKSQTGDTEGLVNYALSMEGIVFASLLIEREDGVKLSFRSKGEFSVSEFARKHFNGGGHRNAAGGTSDTDFAGTVKKFMDIIPDYKEQLLENYRKEKFIC
jgi:bifunctional oligoribonuclease and PAP phosphatase NrnA